MSDQRAAGAATPTPILPADRILGAYENGHAGLLVTGRSLYDLVADGASILTIQEHLRRRARTRHGMAMLTYSIAAGLQWDEARVDDERDRRTIKTALHANDLHELPAGAAELTRVMRGITSLMRTSAEGMVWSDGTQLRFLVLLEFAEHLTPSGEGVGRTDHEIAAVEFAHILGQSNALRQSGNLLVLHGRDGHVDELVSAAMHPIRLLQPDEHEKASFLTLSRSIHSAAAFETGVTDATVARLMSNTPNRSLEVQMRASHRSGVPLTVGSLIAQKSADVIALSEGTLSLLDVRRLAGLELVGLNTTVPLRALLGFADGLLSGDHRIPSNVLLAGPPSSGKTDCALFVADRAKAAAYQVHSPKGGIVGETERKARTLTGAMAEWTPNVSCIDEITEAFPLQRTDFDGDSGASRAVMAALLTALSDESRRGRSLLIATTNCPWRIGAAMCSRFTLIPVLGPLCSDYPSIIKAIATRMVPENSLSLDDLRESGTRFFEKGATPREIRTALGLALLRGRELSAEVVAEAAWDVCVVADRASAEYADLWAVRTCTSKRFFPWSGTEASYPFPEHLDGVVDRQSGELDLHLLEQRIATLAPKANL
ncbi:MAG TPA: ATP-binding protein [Gemmatimonadaceae bacterium]|nr:ATP-binding protein [Gemmatimonadaceae bacterium]